MKASKRLNRRFPYRLLLTVISIARKKPNSYWNTDNKNCVQIAKMAEDCGIQALALHGRTRACMYKGEAEYESIKAAKQAVSIPVIANGDIDSPEKAKFVLEYRQ